MIIKIANSKRRASLVAQLEKNLPAIWETWVRSLGWEDPLEKGMATHFSILAWRIPWTIHHKESGTTEQICLIIYVLIVREGFPDGSVVKNFLQPYGLYSPWNSPGQNTRMGSLSLLQGIFPTQGSNSGLLHCRQILYQLSHKESPRKLEWVAYPFSSGSSWPRNQTELSCIAGRFFTNWAMREAIPYYYYLLAALGLHCCARAFSSYSEQGLLSNCSAWACHCSDFTCCRAQALECMRFSSRDTWAPGYGSVVVAHRLNSPTAHGMVPDQGLNLLTPALAGGFLTTGPPGKSLKYFDVIYLQHKS